VGLEDPGFRPRATFTGVTFLSLSTNSSEPKTARGGSSLPPTGTASVFMNINLSTHTPKRSIGISHYSLTGKRLIQFMNEQWVWPKI